MELHNIWLRINELSEQDFENLCTSISYGLGFNTTKEYYISGLDKSFLDNIIRESTDKLFKSTESWLICYLRKDINHISIQETIKNIKGSGVENVFLAIFGPIPEKIKNSLHDELKKEKISCALICDELANTLIYDYSQNYRFTELISGVSIQRLRESAIKQSQDATWRTQFQTLSAIAPTKITSVQGRDEADLFRAMSKTGSFLLLGEPGGGKTTSLRVLAEELAKKGGRTPIYMPLNQYTGNLLVDIGRYISGEDLFSADIVKNLIDTGGFTIILDGLNEVQPASLQSKIREEIDRFTEPNTTTSRSQWIVSGRKFDYSVSRKLVGLEFLEGNTWEIQPLTPDLIFSFLKDGLSGSEQDALSIYRELDTSVMEICANPLMLNMFFTVYKEKNILATGRGKLYGHFIDLLMNWGDEKTFKNLLKSLSVQLDQPINKQAYHELVSSILISFSKDMIGTSLPWEEVPTSFINSITPAKNPAIVADLIRKDLIGRGLLKLQGRRVSFAHHTFQEYFQALSLKGMPVDSIIPSSGVDGQKREQIVFLAGIVDELANALLARAIVQDSDLAYDIYRNALSPIEEKHLLSLAKIIWNKTISGRDWIGRNKSYAIRFSHIAKTLSMSIKDLAERIIVPINHEEFSDQLLRFFQELGDLVQQQAVIGQFDDNSDDLPDTLLYRMAVFASNNGQLEKAIKLYTKYIKKWPLAAAAYGNRASVYNALGKITEAREDYEKSISLNPQSPIVLTAYSRLLRGLGENEKAIEQLKNAVSGEDKKYPQAHYEYGLTLESKSPEEALAYFETAAKLADSRDTQELYTKKLAENQGKTNQFSQAIRSYKTLIQLNPTSSDVRKWKETIAELRLQIDALEKRRSTRDRLREKEDVLLGILVKDFLAATGLKTDLIAPQLFLCEGGKLRLPSQIAVALLDTPQLTASLVRDAVDSVGDHLPFVNDIIIVTSADELDFDARMQLLTYRTSDKRVALITSLETQEAFLRGDDICVELIDRSFRRSTDISDPFERRVPIKDRADFFGRDSETQKIRALVQNQEPFGLFGIHKIGKSSLLNRVVQSLAAYSPDMTIISLELTIAFRKPSDIYKRILEALPQEVDIPHGEITTGKFRERIIQFQKQMNSLRQGHRLLFIFDECAYLIPDNSGNGGIDDFLDLLGFLKSFRQEMDWFNFALCGRSPSISRTFKWKQGENPLISFLKDIFLGPLTSDETAELIKSLGVIASLQFNDEIIENIYSITGGHPAFTRMLGSQIKNNIKSGVVTKVVVDNSVKSYLRNNSERQLLLKIYQESLDSIEKEIVRELVVKKEMRRSELLSKYTDDEVKRQVRDAINNLIDTTVIFQDDNKILSNRYELLRLAIEQELSELGAI